MTAYTEDDVTAGAGAWTAWLEAGAPHFGSTWVEAASKVVLDAVADRIAARALRRHRREVERWLRMADAPEDSMATDEDVLRYEGRAEAVGIVRECMTEDWPADPPTETL